LACGIGFGTWAGVVALFDFGSGAGGAGEALAWLGLLAVLGGVAAYTLFRRVDAFPLAVVAGSLIVLSSAAIVRYGRFDDIGAFFILAFLLIVSSTISGHFLMRVVRAWHGRAVSG